MEKCQTIRLSPYEYKGTEYQVFLTHGDLFTCYINTLRQVRADSRAGLEKKIVDYAKSVRDYYARPLLFKQHPADPIKQIDSMEKRTDIDLSPYECQDNKFRVFLTHDDKFASSVPFIGSLVADSRAELEAGIERHVRGFQSFFGRSRLTPITPIMRIDSNTTDGFGLTRFQVMLPTKGLYSWHTHHELSVHFTDPLPATFPTEIAELPFIDIPVGKAGWVYYGVFKEHVWTAFQKFNARLSLTVRTNKNEILADLVTDKDIYDLYTSSQLEYSLYLEYIKGV